jgi:dTDP-4-amino-4,6-dideoxygalactose transaminase
VFEGVATGSLPGAEWLCERHICLPVTAVMTDEDVDLVVASLDAALGRA